MIQDIINNIVNLKNQGATIDICHVYLLFGTLISSKPKNILEIGIGTSLCSNILLKGIEYNGFGTLTCVDNLYDLGGNLPYYILDNMKSKANIIISNEKDFVFNCKDNSYDFLISDGDHNHAGEWVEQIFRIIQPNSFMFFHDVSESYPNLINYKIEADKLNKPNHLFNISSRFDENCKRGFLMIENKK